MEAAQTENGAEQIRNLDHAIRHAYRVFDTLFQLAEQDAAWVRWRINSVSGRRSASTAERVAEDLFDLGDLGVRIRNRERRENTIEARQFGADRAVRFAELLEQPTEAQRRLADLFRIGDNAINPNSAVRRAYERMIDAHEKDWSVFFRTLQEGIDALLQGAELLATMPGADAVSYMPRLRSAIQTAKQQSVRMGEFVIEPPTGVSWGTWGRPSGRSDAGKAYFGALRELTRASLIVASDLLDSSYEPPSYEPPPLE